MSKLICGSVPVPDQFEIGGPETELSSQRHMSHLLVNINSKSNYYLQTILYKGYLHSFGKPSNSLTQYRFWKFTEEGQEMIISPPNSNSYYEWSPFMMQCHLRMGPHEWVWGTEHKAPTVLFGYCMINCPSCGFEKLK